MVIQPVKAESRMVIVIAVLFISILYYKETQLISISNVILLRDCFLLFLQSNKKTVVVAQLVRASDCDSEGRGFEPPRLPQPKPNTQKGFGFFMPIGGPS